jgi:hypothetical protein
MCIKVDFMVKFRLSDTTVVIETMSGKLKWSSCISMEMSATVAKK